MSYFRNILISFDQLLNTIFCGYPDETLSSRAYRLDRDGKTKIPRQIIDFVASVFRDFDHCRKSYEGEVQKKQMPRELR